MCNNYPSKLIIPTCGILYRGVLLNIILRLVIKLDWWCFTRSIHFSVIDISSSAGIDKFWTVIDILFCSFAFTNNSHTCQVPLATDTSYILFLLEQRTAILYKGITTCVIGLRNHLSSSNSRSKVSCLWSTPTDLSMAFSYKHTQVRRNWMAHNWSIILCECVTFWSRNIKRIELLIYPFYTAAHSRSHWHMLGGLTTFYAIIWAGFFLYEW